MGSSTERTRTSITNSLKKKLADLMQEFTALRNNIVNQYRDVVERRLAPSFMMLGVLPHASQHGIDTHLRGHGGTMSKQSLRTECVRRFSGCCDIFLECLYPPMHSSELRIRSLHSPIPVT
jgi:hypothetical protein